MTICDKCKKEKELTKCALRLQTLEGVCFKQVYINLCRNCIKTFKLGK